jgi:hypothetical protein
MRTFPFVEMKMQGEQLGQSPWGLQKKKVSKDFIELSASHKTRKLHAGYPESKFRWAMGGGEEQTIYFQTIYIAS